VLSAWNLVHEQMIVAPMGGLVGINWAGAREPLKSFGYWDEERDCIPEELVDGLRIVCAEYVAWKRCEACREADKRPEFCSKCGKRIVEPKGRGRGTSAKDELEAQLEEDGELEDY
jgi:hypothetical protein